MRRRSVIAGLSGAALCFRFKPAAGQSSLPPERLAEKVEGLFAPHLDPLEVRLQIDSLIDPANDPNWVRTQIDQFAAILLEMIGPITNAHEKLKVLRRFIYEAGTWNDKRPFAYDMTDPRGRRLRISSCKDTSRRGRATA